MGSIVALGGGREKQARQQRVSRRMAMRRAFAQVTAGYMPPAAAAGGVSAEAAEAELPRLLAALVEAGVPDLALEALMDWGRGQDPVDVLDRARTYAAVAGLRYLMAGHQGSGERLRPE